VEKKFNLSYYKIKGGYKKKCNRGWGVYPHILLDFLYRFLYDRGMTMKINCDKCGYILGGIEVKENYGCNACNPFWKNIKSMNGGNPVNPQRGVKVGDGDGEIMKSFVMPKAPTRPPLPIKYCGICARILTQTSIGTYYNHDTAEQYNHWRFTCPEYRWWKVWDRYHTNFRCDEDGSTYAYKV